MFHEQAECLIFDEKMSKIVLFVQLLQSAHMSSVDVVFQICLLDVELSALSEQLSRVLVSVQECCECLCARILRNVELHG